MQVQSAFEVQDKRPARTTLDGLLQLSADELEPLYRGASVPELGALRGDLRGRMLAWARLPRPLVNPVRAWAGSRAFPWRGKSFGDRDGVNRVISDRFRVFRFETSIGPSRAGDFDALQLDYDLPGNPFFIRAIEDEVRELSPGLWLGQAWLSVRGRKHLVLYFGLTSEQAS